MKVFLDETSLNGDIYASPTVAVPESPLPVPLSSLLQHGIGIVIVIMIMIVIVIGWLPPLSDAAAKAVTEALVSSKSPSGSSRTMIWRLTKRDRGR